MSDYNEHKRTPLMNGYGNFAKDVDNSSHDTNITNQTDARRNINKDSHDHIGSHSITQGDNAQTIILNEGAVMNVSGELLRPSTTKQNSEQDAGRVKSSNCLSVTDQNTIDLIQEQVETNNLNIAALNDLVQIAKKSNSEDVQYLYYLLLAILNPTRYIRLYENSNSENYWQTFWAYMTYKRCSGCTTEAIEVLDKLSNWEGRAQNALLLQCAGWIYDFLRYNAGDEIINRSKECLEENCTEISPKLKPFRRALLTVVNRGIRDNHIDLYLRLFGDVKPAASPPKEPVSSKNTTISNKKPDPVKIDTPTPTNAPKTYTKEVFEDRKQVENKPKWAIFSAIAIVALLLVWLITPYLGDDKTIASITKENSQDATEQTEDTGTQIDDTPRSEQLPDNGGNTQIDEPGEDPPPPPPPPTVTEPVLSAEELYYKGLSLNKDFKHEEALKYFEEATSKGCIDAYYEIGQLYRYGSNGFKKSHPKAFENYQIAANAGHVEAQYELGMMYRNGYGTPKNLRQAAHWLYLAAEQGHKIAKQQYNELN